ncbi:hypothetical protein V8C44DRAFT_343175 [Trichoderma aethiopicum]
MGSSSSIGSRYSYTTQSLLAADQIGRESSSGVQGCCCCSPLPWPASSLPFGTARSLFSADLEPIDWLGLACSSLYITLTPSSPSIPPCVVSVPWELRVQQQSGTDTWCLVADDQTRPMLFSLSQALRIARGPETEVIPDWAPSL